jgi:hypothetical protein
VVVPINTLACELSSENDSFGEYKAVTEDSEDMAKEDRVAQLLEVMADVGSPLPSKALYLNARLRGARFSRRTVDGYLAELRDRGLVRRVDPDAMENGDLVDAGDDVYRAYWIISEDGLEHISD